MASNYVLERTRQENRVREITFAGDKVSLAGQMDYPAERPPLSGTYPLVFVLHHAGGNTRADYEHYTRMALRAGYAVFRWDKRGTGRSGASGRGSATQDAVYAYEAALDQPMIDNRRVVILAQNEATLLLGDTFGLFARLQAPAGVILVGNMLNEEAVLAITAPVCIIQGEYDWNQWKRYARAACAAHNEAYAYGADYYVAGETHRTLMVEDHQQLRFHKGARSAMQDWLKSL
ncbi:MAG: alpha/beta hydrolase [Anaerolineae bacterium]